MDKNIYEKLINVQAELRAPKGQRNDFGRYNYRSCEDILSAVKPILQKNGLCLTLSDELILIGDRYYIKATATLTNINNPIEIISNTAYAREEETKKGMDGSQITGASSSYARKYTLAGLLGIDGEEDSDATNDGNNEKKQVPKQAPKQFVKQNQAPTYITNDQKQQLEQLNINIVDVAKYLKITDINQLPQSAVQQIINKKLGGVQSVAV